MDNNNSKFDNLSAAPEDKYITRPLSVAELEGTEAEPGRYPNNIYHLMQKLEIPDNPDISQHAKLFMERQKASTQGALLVECLVDAFETSNAEELAFFVQQVKQQMEGYTGIKASDPTPNDIQEMLNSRGVQTVHFATGSLGDRLFFQYDKEKKSGRMWVRTEEERAGTVDRYNGYANLFGVNKFDDADFNGQLEVTFSANNPGLLDNPRFAKRQRT